MRSSPRVGLPVIGSPSTVGVDRPASATKQQQHSARFSAAAAAASAAVPSATTPFSISVSAPGAVVGASPQQLSGRLSQSASAATLRSATVTATPNSATASVPPIAGLASAPNAWGSPLPTPAAAATDSGRNRSPLPAASDIGVSTPSGGAFGSARKHTNRTPVTSARSATPQPAGSDSKRLPPQTPPPNAEPAPAPGTTADALHSLQSIRNQLSRFYNDWQYTASGTPAPTAGGTPNTQPTKSARSGTATGATGWQPLKDVAHALHLTSSARDDLLDDMYTTLTGDVMTESARQRLLAGIDPDAIDAAADGSAADGASKPAEDTKTGETGAGSEASALVRQLKASRIGKLKTQLSSTADRLVAHRTANSQLVRTLEHSAKLRERLIAEHQATVKEMERAHAQTKYEHNQIVASHELRYHELGMKYDTACERLEAALANVTRADAQRIRDKATISEWSQVLTTQKHTFLVTRAKLTQTESNLTKSHAAIASLTQQLSEFEALKTEYAETVKRLNAVTAERDAARAGLSKAAITESRLREYIQKVLSIGHNPNASAAQATAAAKGLAGAGLHAIIHAETAQLEAFVQKL